MALKIELPDITSKSFPDVGAAPMGAGMSSAAVGSGNVPGVASVTPVLPRVPDNTFSTGGSNINMDVIRGRAWARIDYPDWAPRDNGDWAVLKQIGEVAGDFGDFMLNKAKERAEQEDLIAVTDLTTKYHRTAKEIYDREYASKISPYATENDKLAESYQQSLSEAWGGLVQATPLRERARLAATARQADITQKYLEDFTTKAFDFEDKYAFKMMKEGNTAAAQEMMDTGEFGMGPKRLSILQRREGELRAFAASKYGNALKADMLYDDLRDQGSKGVIHIDASKNPAAFLAAWRSKSNPYAVQLGTVQDQDGKEIPINFMSLGAQEFGEGRANTIQTRMEARALAEENRRLNASMQMSLRLESKASGLVQQAQLYNGDEDMVAAGRAELSGIVSNLPPEVGASKLMQYDIVTKAPIIAREAVMSGVPLDQYLSSLEDMRKSLINGEVPQMRKIGKELVDVGKYGKEGATYLTSLIGQIRQHAKAAATDPSQADALVEASITKELRSQGVDLSTQEGQDAKAKALVNVRANMQKSIGREGAPLIGAAEATEYTHRVLNAKTSDEAIAQYAKVKQLYGANATEKLQVGALGFFADTAALAQEDGNYGRYQAAKAVVTNLIAKNASGATLGLDKEDNAAKKLVEDQLRKDPYIKGLMAGADVAGAGRQMGAAIQVKEGLVTTAAVMLATGRYTESEVTAQLSRITKDLASGTVYSNGRVNLNFAGGAPQEFQRDPQEYTAKVNYEAMTRLRTIRDELAALKPGDAEGMARIKAMTGEDLSALAPAQWEAERGRLVANFAEMAGGGRVVNKRLNTGEWEYRMLHPGSGQTAPYLRFKASEMNPVPSYDDGPMVGP